MMGRTRCHALGFRTVLLCALGVVFQVSERSLGAQGIVASRDADGTDAKQGQALLARPVSVNITHVSRRHAIDLLAKNAHVIVQYRVPLLDAFPDLVDVHVTNVPLGVALEQVLNGTKLRVVSDAGRRLSIITLGSVADSVPQMGTISGRVVDSASGRGVGGATVKVQGTKLAAISSDSGRFTIRGVPVGNQVLTVRLFGYRPVTEEVTVAEREASMVRVPMAATPNVLSGVVTTATGTQRRIEVGNDITTLNVDSVMRTAPVTNLTDLLATRVPGLTVLHSSGEPGDPARIRLRGAGSITSNNDPIVIVDGVRVYASQSDPRNDNLAPSANLRSTLTSSYTGTSVRSGFAAQSPIDQINVNSIETLEVFKGPSAAALYGSDAANGVIVITTKKGRAGPTHWDLALGQGVNWIPGTWPENYFRFGADVNGAEPICNWNALNCIRIDSVRSFQALNDPRYTVLGHGSDQTAALTISGGISTLFYSVTGNGSNTLGNLKLPRIEQDSYEAAYGAVPRWMTRPDRLQTWGVDGSLTAQPSTALQVMLQSSMFNSAQQTSSLRDALMQLEGIYVSGGNIIAFNGSGSSSYGVYPLATTALVNNYVERVTDDQVTTKNMLTLNWKPRPWLPAVTVTGGLQTIQRTDNAYIAYGVNNAGPNACRDNPSCVSDTTGYYGLGRGLSRNQTLTAGTTFPFLRQHGLVAIGGNYYSGSTNDFQGATSQLAPGVSSPASFLTPGCTINTSNCGIAQQRSSSSATYGWYLEPRLNISSRFFMSPGFRLDGGSGGTHASGLGGAGGGLSAFPKLDFSYVAVNREDAPPLWGVLSLLRPRLAVGFAGTQPAPAERLRLFNVAAGGNTQNQTDFLNGAQVPVVKLGSLGNTQLHPERSRELEGGFDVTLWNDRFSMTYTQYDKTRKDAIISVPVAPSVFGGAMISDNIGEVRNTGTEITVNAKLLNSRVLGWNVGSNLTNDNNRLVHLNPGKLPDYNTGLVPGYPLWGRWVLPIRAFADQNHDGIIEKEEIVLGDTKVYVGQPNPKYTVNFNTDVHLLSGRLGIYATFAYQSGGMQDNEAALTSTAFRLVGNNPATPLSYQAALLAALQNGGTSYGLIQTVSTFRFNTLSVNYELPRTAASWFRVPRVTASLEGSNLGLHTNYRGKDPDVNAFSTVSSGDQTLDLGQIPEPRTWWLKFMLGN